MSQCPSVFEVGSIQALKILMRYKCTNGATRIHEVSIRRFVRFHSVTSQHVLYYCTYYSVSFACTVHCTCYIYCTLYIQYMFPVSLVPMLRFHLQHLFTLLFTLIVISSLVYSLITCVHITLILTKLLPSA